MKAHGDKRADRKGVIYAVRDREPARLLRPRSRRAEESRALCRITLAGDLPVNSVQAHFRWERGTNENANGLTSEYLRKGMGGS